ncbi:MAG: serine hydrolase [Gammaproteobacteria bacterium]|nr:serine hydrolase [Gammaproteobacteria bacterium]
MSRTCLYRWTITLFLLSPLLAEAADPGGLDRREIDVLVGRAMQTFDVPGMAVGVIKDGEVRYAKGHGVRELGQAGDVDTDTMFKIASNSKAFTAAALAILVDEGRIEWNGAVSDYIPEFRMMDSWVTAELSVVDLLSHRAGLVPHAGDLMLWPDPNDFTRADVIRGMRYFPLVSEFRDSYNYDNVLYIVAGEIVPRMTGQSFESFVDARIMQPLDMDRCFAGDIPDSEMNNLAAPHGIVDDELTVIERSRIHGQPALYAAAGGLVCSLDDMLKWVELQLGRGTTPDGVTVFSQDRSREMWHPENSWRVSRRNHEWHRTHFNGYGLGWRLSDVHGFKEVSHTGSLAGMRAWTLMIPELDLGIVILANGSSAAARNAVMQTIKYSFLPDGQRDWIALYEELDESSEPETEQHTPTARTVVEPRALAEYAGRYRDPWFGEVMVRVTDSGLEFDAAKSPKLRGMLEHVTGDTFVARWPDRSVGMDAWVRFAFDRHGTLAGMRMNRVFDTPDATIDYFEHLEFKPLDSRQAP